MSNTLTATAKMPVRWNPDANDGAGASVSEPTEYTYQSFTSLEDALAYFDGDEAKVLDKLNAQVKDSAKNNAYSAALNKVQPIPVEKVRETLVRSMLKLGMSQEQAESQADNVIANS